MKKLSILFVLSFAANVTFSQEIIKGLKNTVSLVQKSAKLPSIKNKDGSTIVLSYKETEGLMVTMGKNGKNSVFSGPFPNALMVQVGEMDIDNDGKPEILVGTRTSAEAVEVEIYKKAAFEIFYKLWSTLTGFNSFEFTGDGHIKLYDMKGNFGLYTIMEDGKLNAM